MRIITTPNYDPEDMIPYAVVREHLRYDYGDAEELMKSYVASACDYLQDLTNRTFSSSVPIQSETGDGQFSPSNVVRDADAVVYLDRSDVDKIQTLRTMSGFWVNTQIMYLNDQMVYTTLGNDAKVRFNLGGYPLTVDMTKAELPADLNADYDTDLFKLSFVGGDSVGQLPKQFRQAMLLLVGHYDSQREAEYIGGLTSEVKEGVHRLMSTVKLY